MDSLSVLRFLLEDECDGFNESEQRYVRRENREFVDEFDDAVECAPAAWGAGTVATPKGVRNVREHLRLHHRRTDESVKYDSAPRIE